MSESLRLDEQHHQPIWVDYLVVTEAAAAVTAVASELIVSNCDT
jgi:hypothetical protein